MIKNYDTYCMNFSNEELVMYFVQNLREKADDKVSIRLFSENYEEIEFDSSEKIAIIVIDGDEENLSIHFYGMHTSINIFEEEIMFIDDKSKTMYTSSDLYGNIIFEGNLRNMSHKEILNFFIEIIMCFIDAKKVEVKQESNEEKDFAEWQEEDYSYVDEFDF